MSKLSIAYLIVFLFSQDDLVVFRAEGGRGGGERQCTPGAAFCSLSRPGVMRCFRPSPRLSQPLFSAPRRSFAYSWKNRPKSSASGLPRIRDIMEELQRVNKQLKVPDPTLDEDLESPEFRELWQV